MTAAAASVPTNEITLQIHRTYNADPLTVFNAWIQPELIKEWFGPPNRTITSLTTDPRPGGGYRFELESRPPDPLSVFTVWGTYTAFEPGKLLAFTWESNFIPGEETLVTVALKPSGNGTDLLLTHERFHTEPSREAHNKGWNMGLDKLAKLFPAA